jgi:hypothetical protein
VCPRMRRVDQINERLLRVLALDGCVGSTDGHDELVECGFVKGNDTPKRHDVLHK